MVIGLSFWKVKEGEFLAAVASGDYTYSPNYSHCKFFTTNDQKYLALLELILMCIEALRERNK